MKKFFSKKVKCSVLVITIAVIVLIALIIILAVCGFKITYSPELENSWDAVSACAGWAGAIFALIGVAISGLAIYYAVQVPKKIAEQQNKIALFEKRYECFQFYEKCHLFYCDLLKMNDIKDLRECFSYMFNLFDYNKIDEKCLYNKIEYSEYMLHKMEFLFSFIQEDDIYSVYHTLQRLLISIVQNKDIEVTKLEYIKAMKIFINKYNNAICDALNINNIN